MFLSALWFVFISMMPYIHLFPPGSALLARNIILTHQHSSRCLQNKRESWVPEVRIQWLRQSSDRMCEVWAKAPSCSCCWGSFLHARTITTPPQVQWAQGHRVSVHSCNRHLIWHFSHKSIVAKKEHLKGCWDSWRIHRMGRLKMCQAAHGQLQAHSASQCSKGHKQHPASAHCINTPIFRHFIRCAACRIPHSPAVLLPAQSPKV